MDSKNILNHENLHFRKMKQIDMGMEETKKKKGVHCDKHLLWLQSDKNYCRDKKTLNQTKIRSDISCLKYMYRNLVLYFFNIIIF